ncbi:MAG TPA: O-antigen ligase family protein [Longilinea sp.]|nr:O-antigen ligase family protein [Longilinea sp.]
MKRIRLAPFDLPVLVFWFSALLGSFVPFDPITGQRTLIALTGIALLYFFVSRASDSERRWDGFAAVLVGLSALAALYFITQAGHIDYEEKVGLIDRVAKWIASFLPAFPFWQPVPNSLGTFLEGSLFAAIGLALLDQRRSWRILYWILCAIIAAGLLFSVSRGAWLGVVGAALLWAAVHWKPARVLAFAAAAGMLGMILLVLIRGDISALSDIPILGSLAGALFIRPDRLEVYCHSLALLAEQPFTGIGLGNAFAMVYSRYELLLAVPFLYYSHNLLLEVWLQQGLLGAAAFVWLIALLCASLLRYPAFKSDLRIQAACAGLTAILLHGLSDARQYPSLWTWLPFFFLLGLCAARLLSSRSLVKPRLQWLIPGAVTAFFLIVVLAFIWPPGAAWNANRAGLLQTRADLDPSLTQEQQSAIRSESEALFIRALSSNPASLPINRRYGLLLLSEYRFTEAIPRLEEVYQTTPDHIAARKGLGLAYLWSGELTRAVELLAGLPNISDELQGLAWQEYNDFQHYQTALYTYQLLDQLIPGQEMTRTMIETLKNLIQNGN